MDRDASDERSLSLTNLVIASVSSAAAAVIVHALWKPGTVVAAALTPVLMSLFAEALRRPAELVRVRTGAGDPGRATVEVHHSSRRWGRAVVVGLAAFVLGAVALTASEALLNRAIAGGEGATTLLDGARGPATTPVPTSASPTLEPTATTDAQRDRETPDHPDPTPTSAATAPAQPTPTPTPTPAAAAPTAAPTPTPP